MRGCMAFTLLATIWLTTGCSKQSNTSAAETLAEATPAGEAMIATAAGSSGKVKPDYQLPTQAALLGDPDAEFDAMYDALGCDGDFTYAVAWIAGRADRLADAKQYSEARKLGKAAIRASSLCTSSSIADSTRGVAGYAIAKSDIAECSGDGALEAGEAASYLDAMAADPTASSDVKTMSRKLSRKLKELVAP